MSFRFTIGAAALWAFGWGCNDAGKPSTAPAAISSSASATDAQAGAAAGKPSTAPAAVSSSASTTDGQAEAAAPSGIPPASTGAPIALAQAKAAASPASPVAASGATVLQAQAGAAPEAGAAMSVSASQPSAAGSGADSGPPTPSYTEIISSDWELAPGAETYFCLRKTAEVDMRIHQFRTDLPTGTHHLGLYVNPTPDKADAMIECNLFETGERSILGAGPGSSEFSLPPGVALRVDKGNQLLLQLHVLNTSEATLRGRSAVSGVMLAKEEVRAEAQVIAAQLISLAIPPGPSSAAGRCTFDRAQTLVAFGAHMHENGRHAKLVLHRAKGGEQVLLDAGFDVNDQRRYPLDLIEVATGDYVDYECSYENPSSRTIYWGETAADEMCLFNIYRFPAGGETLCLL